MAQPGDIRSCSTCRARVECVSDYFWRHLDSSSRCPNMAGGYRRELDEPELPPDYNAFDDQAFLNGGY